MTRTVADRMVESAGRGWVGREREIDALLSAATADEPPFLVAFVHGPGGIGKSHLVRRLLDGLPAPVRGAYLDGRDVEPTPRGLRRALGQALGSTAADPDVGALARALAARPTVLVIDTYEALGLLDAWLRTQFLPALPATTLTVLAGRDRPATAWHTTAGWQGLVAEFPLAALSADEADRLLRRRGLDERQARWAGEFAHGHPLALELAAAAVRADPRCTKAERWRPTACWKRSSGSSRPLPSPSSRPRRPSAGSPSPSSPRCSRRRRPAPLSTSCARCRSRSRRTTGLLLHDVVRDTVGNDLAMRDPDRRRAYRRRAVAHLTEHRPGSTADPWLRTADLMFLIENPVLRDACFPSVRPAYWVEPAAQRDRAAVFDIVARHESPAVLARWWERHAETFSVARGADGAVAAFVQIAELDRLGSLPADDPVADAWLAHLRDHPPAADDRVLVMRRWLGRRVGGAALARRVGVLAGRQARLHAAASTAAPHLLGRRRPAAARPDLRPARLRARGRPGAGRRHVAATRLARLRPGERGRLAGRAHRRRDDGDAGRVPTAGSVIGLSSRELEVLRLVADGRSNREIGELLFISEKTAGRHLSNIFTKLDVHSRAEAARIAAEQGSPSCRVSALQRSGQQTGVIARCGARARRPSFGASHLRRHPVHTLVITFDLVDMTHERYTEVCAELAPPSPRSPACWPRSGSPTRTSGRYGGVYLFADAAAGDGFLGSALARSVATNPHFAGLTVQRFGVDEVTTARTQPAVTVVGSAIAV